MLQIQLRQPGNLPIEVFGTSPDALRSLSLEDIRQHKVYVGNRAVEFGSLFEISGSSSDEQQLWNGELRNVSGIGYRMQSGWIQIDGTAAITSVRG
jgi:formylmethanofuran dehydrogenase subunit C